MRLGQFLDATATAKQFVTEKAYAENDSGTRARQPFESSTRARATLENLGIPQSEYPLNVGKSAVPVEVPVTPKLTPEVLDDTVDEGSWVDREDDVEELIPVWQFTPRMKESKKAKQ